jgi:hypothetical protein
MLFLRHGRRLAELGGDSATEAGEVAFIVIAASHCRGYATKKFGTHRL